MNECGCKHADCDCLVAPPLEVVEVEPEELLEDALTEVWATDYGITGVIFLNPDRFNEAEAAELADMLQRVATKFCAMVAFKEQNPQLYGTIH